MLYFSLSLFSCISREKIIKMQKKIFFSHTRSETKTKYALQMRLREGECVCVCVCVIEWVKVWVSERVWVCVRVWVCMRERECVFVRVCECELLLWLWLSNPSIEKLGGELNEEAEVEKSRTTKGEKSKGEKREKKVQEIKEGKNVYGGVSQFGRKRFAFNPFMSCYTYSGLNFEVSIRPVSICTFGLFVSTPSHSSSVTYMSVCLSLSLVVCLLFNLYSILPKSVLLKVYSSMWLFNLSL